MPIKISDCYILYDLTQGVLNVKNSEGKNLIMIQNIYIPVNLQDKPLEIALLKERYETNQ